MKISYQWLQEFVDIDILGLEIEEVGHALTMVGLAVDVIEEFKDDFIFDVDVTTNRVDCLNHLGVARELAAQFRLKLKKPDFSPLPNDETKAGEFPVDVLIEDSELCPRYAARVMTNVTVGESPGWLKKRLESVGQRPINAIVDVTNFVLFEIGQPLHAFDYQLLADSKIVVRRARQGERLETLDGTVRDLDDSMLLICDGDKPVAVGGVMGGADSEISGTTKTILLESAYFEPSSIRSTARKLGLSTEASYRFERGGDPGLQVLALNRACSLIAEICRGTCVSPVIDEVPVERTPQVLTLRGKRIAQVLGTTVPAGDVETILSCLEFQPEEVTEDVFKVEVPSFRRDVGLEDDLVEEVARHYGYDRIPSHYPASTEVGRYAESEKSDRLLISTLVGAGFFEAINYAFTTPAREAAFTEIVPPMVPVANPLTELDTHLRTTMIPGLIESVKQNLNHGVDDVRLFETGKSSARETRHRLKPSKRGGWLWSRRGNSMARFGINFQSRFPSIISKGSWRSCSNVCDSQLNFGRSAMRLSFTRVLRLNCCLTGAESGFSVPSTHGWWRRLSFRKRSFFPSSRWRKSARSVSWNLSMRRCRDFHPSKEIFLSCLTGPFRSVQ